MNIPYGRQNISQDDIKAVTDVLQSPYLTQGPAVPAFEKALAQRVGAKHALAVNSATSALHIACVTLGLQKGDSLWTTPNTFVASANCGLYCNASVDFVDTTPDTYVLDPKALEDKLSQTPQEKHPRILVVVHMCGQPADMKKIKRICDAHNIRIIEDASHAVGAQDQGEPTGSCKYSDITVFSFHPVKILTTAEGGMALTNDDRLAAQMDRLRSHGITRDPELMTSGDQGGWYYEQIELGWNYRMTELQAALGLSQLDRLDTFLKKRHLILKRYEKLLEEVDVVLPQQREGVYSALHLYPVLFKDSQTRKTVYEKLRAKGIFTQVHYIPVYWQPYYQAMGFKKGYCPVAESVYQRTLSLPMYPDLTEEQQSYVVECIKEILND